MIIEWTALYYEYVFFLTNEPFDEVLVSRID